MSQKNEMELHNVSRLMEHKSKEEAAELVADCDRLETEPIQSRIMMIRNVPVLIDKDIADLYDVETKVLNQAVKRNLERFPDRFRFQLTKDETLELVTNCDRFKKLKHSSVTPYAFTEQGIAMLSTVLHSPTAIQVSIRIMDAFVAMHHFVSSSSPIFKRLETIEFNQLEMLRHQAETDRRVDEVFKIMEQNTDVPHQGIFFDGQIYDAYSFVADLIRSANNTIVLIDNYIDDTVLTMLDKRKKGVFALIYTARITQSMQLDIEKHNSQYNPIDVSCYRKAHDRFIVIDNNIYHIGASIKDLGKKLFAFSLMHDITVEDLESV